ncbi:MAG: hypothetical protein ACK5LR_07240 [Mangrovibacterium sp.]
MMDADFASEIMNNQDLYSEIVEHRSKYTAWSGFDYKTHHPSCICFVPPSELMLILENDYKKMQESLTFEALILRINELQARFRMLACNTSFFK